MDKKIMNKNHGILLMFHCSQHTGYAIQSLEKVFYSAARKAGFQDSQIYWSYAGVTDSSPNMIDSSYQLTDSKYLIEFIQSNSIKYVIAFDLGYPAPVLKALRKAGVKKIISYWGASMSSLNSGIKLLFKKAEYHLRRYKPDVFVFESKAMQETATHGRGIPKQKTSVVYLGIDTAIFSPADIECTYAHQTLNIPIDRKLVFYSGHMEPRKGVHVIVNAAKKLATEGKIDSVHFILCGNKNNEADIFLDMLANSEAANHVTFAGYRNDIPDLMRSCHLGVIASTGWDSFTLSSIEMMASGLPLLVSNLQGLSETIIHGKNGFLFEPNNSDELAELIHYLFNDEDKRSQLSRASRSRAVQNFDVKKQINALSKLINA